MGLASVEQLNSGQVAGTFIEVSARHQHEYAIGAPTEWAAERGATHTLYTIDGPRPARVKRTVAYIGVDETPEGDIAWERWEIRNHREF